MTNALTLTEAAERLAPVFEEETGTSTALVSSPKGKWLSLDDAASVLTERVTGKAPAARKAKKAEVTISQAARQIDFPFADLTEYRSKRVAAAAKEAQSHAVLLDFVNRAIPLFNGADDDLALLRSPDFQAVYGYAISLRLPYEQAANEAVDAWTKECAAEVEAFEALRPDWSPEDCERVVSMIERFGGTRDELQYLWMTPTPLALSSPICLQVAQRATGINGASAIPQALASVGFSEREIHDAVTGAAPVVLRDHRIQELVARAADADTQTENREAA
jgi:hypothetical protein